MPAERNPLGCSAKVKAIAVAGEVRGCVSRVKVKGFAERTQGEAWKNIRLRVEIGFIKCRKAVGRNDGAGRDAEFLRDGDLIAQKPAADIDGLSSEVLQLDGILRRWSCVRENFIDDHQRNGGGGIIRAR